MKSEDRKVTFESLLRDFLVYILPIKKLPKRLIKRLYGSPPNFIFLVHPRNKEEIYKVSPFLKNIKLFIPEKLFMKLISFCPFYVVSTAEWNNELYGWIISTSMLPEEMFSSADKISASVEKIIKFLRKFSHNSMYVGLAAWWPIVTNNGLLFRRMVKDEDKIIITNGHCATLISIYLSINKICRLANLEFNDLSLLIIGIGRMGFAVAETFNGKVHSIGIIDKNEVRLKVAKEKLEKKTNHSAIKTYLINNKENLENLINLLDEYAIWVCTTSSTDFIIKDVNALKGCIIIDDSRPEAFPRFYSTERYAVVLEGGLIKIDGITVDSDFGFGKQDNVFGCMAEAFMLALDKGNVLRPTLGEIDYSNFKNMLNFCRIHGISEGEFKSGQVKITDDFLIKIIKNKYLPSRANE